MLVKYEHTQQASRLLWAFGVFLILDIIAIEVLVYILAVRNPDALPDDQLLMVMGLIVLILAVILGWAFGMMSSLSVTIDDEYIRLRFGGGLWRKTIPLATVTGCRPVKTSWMLGWGIRMYKNGRLYNITGCDAVELKLNTGKTAAIGTDEPEKLTDAIRGAAGIRTAV